MKEDAAVWLRKYLRAFGPCEVEKVKAEARAQGYTRGELREAKRICLVQATNNWTPKSGITKWFWSLPKEGKGNA